MKYKLDSWDNIYSEKDNRQADILHKFTPSIRVGYTGTPGNHIRASYEADLVDYVDFGENNFQTHRPSFDLGYRSPTGIYLQISDSYTYTRDPFGTLNQYNIGENTERWNNTLSFGLGYEYGIHAVEARYGNYAEG